MVTEPRHGDRRAAKPGVLDGDAFYCAVCRYWIRVSSALGFFEFFWRHDHGKLLPQGLS